VLPLELAVRLYGGTDKGVHGYAPYYSRHTQHRRWIRNRILEIGVGGYQSPETGGSLRIWRDHFPLSRIVGLDIFEKRVSLGPRVGFVHGDQANPDDLAKAITALGGPPDIVIDDGSHLATHAETSFRYLFPLMPSRALYVIEDLHTSYWPEFGGALPAPPDTAVGFTKSLLDAVQAGDVTFTFDTWRGYNRPVAAVRDIAAVYAYPGIVFVRKA
jgi:hypothetical protein